MEWLVLTLNAAVCAFVDWVASQTDISLGTLNGSTTVRDHIWTISEHGCRANAPSP